MRPKTATGELLITPTQSRFESPQASVRVSPGAQTSGLDLSSVRGGIAFLSIFYAVGMAAYYGSHLAGPNTSMGELLASTRFLVLLAGVLVALALGAIARSKRVSDAVAQRSALVWLPAAILALLIAEGWILDESAARALAAPPLLGVSGAVVVISVFPLLVRANVAETSLSAFSAAAMGPLLLIVGGHLPGSVGAAPLLRLSAPLFISAGLAALHALILTRYRNDANRARRLGSYRLGKLLGRGGMGEVWQAHHQMLARSAAIKLIDPSRSAGLPSEANPGVSLLRRFEREVQATSALQSPHTVSVYDYGATEEGTFYYVMELLDGLDARSLVERFGPQPQERVISLMLQACKSLEEAHERGLVHRDIKPANLFVSRQGLEVDFVKVLDFGLVKSLTNPSETHLSGDSVLGTPAYLAPEVALGSPTPDARTDLYGLGAVAYWLLTGQEVFAGETPLAVALQHVQAEPVPPSRRTELDISPELEAVVLSCLAKDPNERPRDARDLCERLAACPMSRPWDRDRAQSWWRDHLPASSPLGRR